MKPIDEQGPILSDDPNNPWSLENLNRCLAGSIQKVIPEMRENPPTGAVRLLLGRSDKQKASDRGERITELQKEVIDTTNRYYADRDKLRKAAPIDYEIIEPEVTTRPDPVQWDWNYYKSSQPITITKEQRCPVPSPSRSTRLLTILRKIWVKISNLGNLT